MINDFISWCISLIDTFYNLIPSQYNLITKISDLINALTQYNATWQQLTGIIFFICGKPLITMCIGVGVAIIVIKLVFAIINIVGQYVP